VILAAILVGLLGWALIATGGGDPGYDAFGAVIILIAVFFVILGIDDIIRKPKKEKK
jgi:UDP-N-acetylmuramyl pentapeptide phosphotransferase/UDP-N-acetylglucosamine-1-phosphate transferase